MSDDQKEKKRLPYGRQTIDEDDIAAVAEVLRGDFITQGDKCVEFEKKLAEYCGARYCVALNSGTSALHIAALAAGITEGDIGYTSPITFVASANCIVYCGGTPKFVDVDPQTINMCPEALANACKIEPPKVIIPVDFTGQPADLPAIYRIAKEYGAVVIQDAAHSIGATYINDGIEYKVGSCAHADMATLSFHPVKHITTGEGGAVLTNDEATYKQLLLHRNHGITKDPDSVTDSHGPWYYEQHAIGMNYRITDFQCALGMSQLKKLDRFVAKRRELVELYKKRFADLADELVLLTEKPANNSSYHLLVAQLSGGLERRKSVFEYLQSENIMTQVHYIPVHLQPYYEKHYGSKPGDFPNAEEYYSGCFSLPLFPKMEAEDVEYVARVVESALEKYPSL